MWLHNTLSGPATKKLMERDSQVFGDMRFERLADISVSHLYNLRGNKPYPNKRRHWTKTSRDFPSANAAPRNRMASQATSVSTATRMALKACITSTRDCVTQMQLVATCEKISEAHSLPVIQQLLEGFPFVILGFHSDNGSAYINHKVAKLLEKLLVEFAMSRPRYSNDNALAESRNVSVVRKHFSLYRPALRSPSAWILSRNVPGLMSKFQQLLSVARN